MGGFHQFDGNKPLVYLLPRDIVSLISDGLLIPPSEEEINDRSKADSFSKLVVLVQTLWFVMQCIARHIEHLPITELEVAALAYTVPILGIYICWWNKPLGVTQPIRVSKSVWDGDCKDPMSLWDSCVESLTGEFHSNHEIYNGPQRISQGLNILETVAGSQGFPLEGPPTFKLT